MSFRTVALILLLLLFGAPARAADAPAASGPKGAAAAVVANSSASPALSHDDLARLLDTIQDPAKRTQLESQLRALIAISGTPAASAPTAPAATPAPQPAAEEGNTAIGAQALDALSAGFEQLGDFARDAARNFGDPQHIWGWIEFELRDPRERALWVGVARGLGLSVGGGLIAAFIAAWLLARGRKRILAARPRTFTRKLGLVLGLLAMELLPIAAFGLLSVLMVGWVAPNMVARLALLAALNAVIWSLAGLAVARALLCPLAPALRLFPISDATALYLYVWARRLVVVTIYGYVALQVAVLLGMPRRVYVVASKLLGLVLVLLLVIFVMQNRDNVAALIAGRVPGEGQAPSVTARIKTRFGQVWHVAAILYLIGAFAVWAFDIPGGFTYLGPATLLTLIVMLGFPPAEKWLQQGFDRALKLDAGLLASYPLVATRANRYMPLFRILLVALLRLAGLLIILAAWRVDVPHLLLVDGGVLIAGRLAGIALVVLLALIAWEIADAAIIGYLERRDGEGRLITRSGRARTLLPLCRNAILILITLMTVLIVLSEIGVDIGPLLAGAGVVGLALGVGAQSLVKDVISGLFILFEDTINVGDVVDINNGTSGVVEGLTVRSIMLRDGNGTVHTLTFGTVTTIANMSRDYAFYPLSIAVSYREDTDQVMTVLRELGEELKADPKFTSIMLAPIEIWGVDKFADSSVVITGRIKTWPGKQSDVGREFNRRMKMRFDEMGIEMPYPSRTLYFGEDHQGHAAAARVAVEGGVEEVHVEEADKPKPAPKPARKRRPKAP